MTRSELFHHARARCQQLLGRRRERPLESVAAQLNYLIDLVEGRTDDRSRLKKINLGVLAARGIEDLDSEFADILHSVSGQADAMRYGDDDSDWRGRDREVGVSYGDEPRGGKEPSDP